jgi:hypothetical protein
MKEISYEFFDGVKNWFIEALLIAVLSAKDLRFLLVSSCHPANFYPFFKVILNLVYQQHQKWEKKMADIIFL